MHFKDAFSEEFSFDHLLRVLTSPLNKEDVVDATTGLESVLIPSQAGT